MAGFAFFPPQFTLVNSSGRPYAGAVARFYNAGTSTGLTVYSDASLATPLGTSVTASSTGVFPPVFIDPEGGSYKVSFFTSAGSLIRTVDDLPATYPLTAAQVGAALYPRTAAEVSASVTPVNYTFQPGDVRRYGYVADDATDNSGALAAALSVFGNGGPVVTLPPGTARFGTSLNLPNKCSIIGSGKDTTILKYTGSAQAFKQATPSARIYEIHLADFSLYDVGSGTVGLDLESVSTSNFERLWIDGFATGIRIHSPTSGYAVYNRFYDVTTNAGANTVGFKLSGTSSNAHLFIGCRANGSSVTGSRGWEITDGNGNQIIGCHPEGLGVAIYITATAPGLAGGNVVMANRIEGNTTGVQVASANVEHTRIIQNHYTLNGTDITDSGTRSIIDDPIAYPVRYIFPSIVAADANGTVRWVRDAEGGASLPFAVFRDSASAGGTPVTVQVETERAAGSFITGKRSATTYFDVKANGVFYCGVLTVATLPAAADHDFYRAIVTDANATTFHSVVAGGGANVVPVFSDGTNWRIG